MSFDRDLDTLLRAGLDALAPVCRSAGARERMHAHVTRRRRNRMVAMGAGAVCAIALVVAVATHADGALSRRGLRVEHPGNGAQIMLPGSAAGAVKPANDRTPPAAQPNGAAAGKAGSNAAGGSGALGRAGSNAGTPPVTSAPNPPTDAPATGTRVDVVLDDGGLHASPAHVPMGDVEVAFTDRRSAREAGETLDVDGLNMHVAAGSTQHYQLGVGTNVVRALQSNPAAAQFTTDAPVLPLPNEPADQITIEMRNGMMTLPFRSTGDAPPYVLGGTAPARQPWISVDVREIRVVVKNIDLGEHEIRFTGVNSRWRVRPKDPQIAFTVTLPVRADCTVMLFCNAPGHSGEHILLWTP